MDDMEKALKKLDNKSFNSMSKDKMIVFGIIIAVLVVAIGIFGFFYYRTNMASVVTFDGGKVTKAEYTIYYKIFSPMLVYYGYPEDQIPSQIANKAGIDKIILMKAKEAGVTLTAEDKAKVDEIFSDKEQVKSFTDKGIDPGKMKQLYYNDYTITEYINKLKADATNDEMLAYIKKIYGETADLKEYVTRQILFSVTDANTGSKMTDEQKATLKAKAEGVLERIKAGEDFAKLASEFSDDTGTKANGGEYKMYLDEKTVTPYVDAVKTLSAGQTYATLVESDYGYHIIKLESINETGRLNSDTEREDYASQKVDEYGVELNMKVDETALKSIVKSITGTEPADSSTNTTDGNTTLDSTGVVAE
ncbi:Foldase protein PrsA 3 precursor [compost metagenome]